MEMSPTVLVVTCRACLKMKHEDDEDDENVQMAALFSTTYKESLLVSNMFRSCTTLETTPDDGMPDTICTPCLTQLIAAYEFKMQCIQADEQFRINYHQQQQTETPTETQHVKNHLVDDSPPQQQIPNEKINDGEKQEEYIESLKTEEEIEVLQDEMEIEEIVESTNEPTIIGQPTFKNSIRLKRSYSIDDTAVEISYLPSLPHCQPINKSIDDDEDDEGSGGGGQQDTAEEGESVLHTCDYCPKSFVKQKVLMRHVKLHPQYQPQQCTVCDRAFVLARQLNEHMNRHAGVKPYKCHVCNKSKNTLFCISQILF